MSEPGTVGAAIRGTGTSIAAVFAHPALRRLQLALAGSMIGDWAYATATTVWAYGVGGAKAVGLWMSIRLVLMAFVSPFAASLADKWPRKLVMVGADLSRCVRSSSQQGSALRPAPHLRRSSCSPRSRRCSRARSALQSVPGCRRWPEDAEQLAAANGVSSTIESLRRPSSDRPSALHSWRRPTDVQTVFNINAGTFLHTAQLDAGNKGRAADPETPSDHEPAEPADEESEGRLTEMLAGFREIRRSRDLGLVAFLMSAQTLVAGA